MISFCKEKRTISFYRGTVSSMATVFKKQKYHRGSIYCMSWDPEGRCLATGSNDKTIKILQFDPHAHSQIGGEVEFNIHAGTVRDLAFVPNRNGYLISGGAGSLLLLLLLLQIILLSITSSIIDCDINSPIVCKFILRK